jgi:hypothetical protein
MAIGIGEHLGGFRLVFSQAPSKKRGLTFFIVFWVPLLALTFKILLIKCRFGWTAFDLQLV